MEIQPLSPLPLCEHTSIVYPHCSFSSSSILSNHVCILSHPQTISSLFEEKSQVEIPPNTSRASNPRVLSIFFSHQYISIIKKRVAVCSKESVPPYGPPLPDPPIFDDLKVLRKFLLTKCMVDLKCWLLQF